MDEFGNERLGWVKRGNTMADILRSKFSGNWRHEYERKNRQALKSVIVQCDCPQLRKTIAGTKPVREENVEPVIFYNGIFFFFQFPLFLLLVDFLMSTQESHASVTGNQSVGVRGSPVESYFSLYINVTLLYL